MKDANKLLLIAECRSECPFPIGMLVCNPAVLNWSVPVSKPDVERRKERAGDFENAVPNAFYLTLSATMSLLQR